MKEGWEEHCFENCFKLRSGDNLTAKNMAENGIYPVFGGNGIAGYHNDYNLSGSNVIIGRVGALCGNVRHITEKIWLTDNAFKIVDFKFDFNHSFLTYLLNYYDLRNYARQAAQPVISNSSLKDVVLSFPKSLREQQRIVSILDEAFAAIAKAKTNAEQNLKNAKELFESYLQGVFENGNENWEVNCLDELGTITSSKRIYKSEYVNEGIPFYRTKEIKELSNGKSISLELFISRDRYKQIKQSFGVPKIGDLLMSAVGTIGEIMVIEDENEFYFKDGNIVWLKDFQRLDTNYLKYALTAFVEKIKSLAIGSAYSALTIEKLNKYKISYPKTKEEQQKIVHKLDALRAETQKLEAVYRKKIADLEELKKSLLQKAFSGEL